MCSSSRHRHRHRHDGATWASGWPRSWSEADLRGSRARPDFDAGPDPDVRASDAERERVVTLLREHAGAGRLSVEELDGRLEAAYAARTRGDLAGLLRDLPRLGDAPRAPAGPPASPFSPGAILLAWAAISAALVVVWLVTGAGAFWPVWAIAPGAFVALKHAARAREGRRTAGFAGTARTPGAA